MQNSRKLQIALAKALVMGCLALMPFALLGQSVRGSLAGTVTDPTGAAITGARLTAVNTETGVSLVTTSTSTGSYAIPEMPLGVYDLRVAASGFRVSAYNGIHITVNSATVQNVELTPGGATETVTVSADALTLQTASSDINGTISSDQISKLPLGLGGMKALRSPQAFTFLLPGAAGPGTATSTNGPSGVYLFKVGGNQELGMETIYDGASQDRALSASGVFDEESPSVEALQEFKLTIANPPAEFGRTTGGVESFSTKSGTNTYHGGLYDIFKNNDLDADTWFNNGDNVLNCTGSNNTPACHATYARPNDKQNDYGGTFGGYVRIPHFYDGKSRTFFFFSWEQFRQSLGATITSTVPTALERTGNFSQFLNTSDPIGTNPCDGTTIYYGEIFDPSTTRTVGGVPCRTAFSGNAFTTSQFSSVATHLLSYYPPPMNGNLTQNYALASSYPILNTTYTARIDESVNSKNQLFFTYDTRKNTQQTASAALPFPVDPNGYHQQLAVHLIRFGWDAVLTPHLLNHLSVGGNRINVSNVSNPIFEGNVDYASQFNYAIGATSYSFLTATVGNGIVNLGKSNAKENQDNSILLSDSISWQKGSHNVKVGIDVRYFQTSAESVPAPTLTFAQGETAATNQSTMIADTGYGLASMLLGAPSAATVNNITVHYPRWLHMYYAGFAQDDFRVSNSLTLNLGIRYEVETPRHEAENQTSNFVPAATDPEYGIPGALVFGSTCTNCNTAWDTIWYENVGPRAGFAWTPPILNRKVVVRGGAGTLYGPLQYDDNAGGMNEGYSVSPSLSSSDSFTPVFSLDSGFPAYALPPNLDPGQYNGQAIGSDYMVAGPGRSAVVNNWSLQVQSQVAQDTLLTVGYVGLSASKLVSNLQDVNNIPIADFTLGNQLTASVTSNTVGVQAPFSGFTTLFGKGGTVQQALRPFPQYQQISSDCCLQALGHSTYNALMVSVQRDLHHGLGFLVSYTRSKDITDSDSLEEGSGFDAGTQIIQNPLNLRGEKAISLQDLPNILVMSYVYELPFGKGRRFANSANGLVNEIIGGWQFSGVQRYQSGIPISFGCASAIPGWNNCSRFSFTGAPIKSAAEQAQTLNPLLTAAGANPAINSLFNGASYGSQTSSAQTNPAFFDQNNSHFRGTGAYTLGNVQRVTGTDRLNPYFNEDFSLTKTFPIRESTAFTLEGEALNATNRHAWALPDVQPDDLLFGVPTGTLNNPRQIQIIGRLTF